MDSGCRFPLRKLLEASKFCTPCEKFHKFALRRLAALLTLLNLVQHTLAIFFSIPLLLALSACGVHFDNSNIDAVNRELANAKQLAENGAKDAGVSPKEVESILGPPDFIETHKLPLETQKKELEITRYLYKQDGRVIEVHFLDNKLIDAIPRQESSSQEKLESDENPRKEAEASEAPREKQSDTP